MTAPNTSFPISKKSQMAVLEFHKQCYQQLNQQWNIREQFRQIDLSYIREKDFTQEQVRAQIANSYGDSNRLQNVTVPVVMPQVESAVTYQASVFLTGEPIFAVSASPQFQDAADQIEAIIAENATHGGWVREFMMFFRDAFKYNLAPIEVVWDRKKVVNLSTDPNFQGGKQAKPTEVYWEGNCIKRLDPYNTFFDGRVAPRDIPEKGEFAGYTELMSRIRLKDFINTLPDVIKGNIKAAFESGIGAGNVTSSGIESYYIPPINPKAIINKDMKATTNWMSWACLKESDEVGIQYKNMYEVTTMYGRILPNDFDITAPGRNTPQIWKFVIVNHSVVILAERQTNAHNLIPILFGQANEDGLMYQTKSLASNVEPMQEVSSALMNSVIASRRRAISDRVLYDPSRISEAHINSANPSAKIPVRPAAYGKNIAEAVYAFPYRDDQSPMAMQQIGFLSQFTNQISGQNPVKQGQFVKGNKTMHEFETVMGNANGRDQMTAMLFEAQIFTPIKMILKSNIIQYQASAELYSEKRQKNVEIDPLALRKAIFEFKVSDGLTPTDKLMNTDVMMVAMQQIGTSPALAAEYNVAPMFSYIMKLAGATQLKEFEKSPQQVTYEGAVSQWQQLVQVLFKQNPELKADQLPPQPKPQDFGYDPNAQLASQQQEQQKTASRGPISSPLTTTS